MKKENVGALIDRLEAYSRKHPGAYRLRVAALAALGYGYLLAVVLGLLLLIYVLFFYIDFNWITVKFAWIILVLVGLVLRSMWVTMTEPDGRELSRENAPRLFELIDELHRTLHGPKVHHVLISDEFNAGIVQIPRLGMFGWPRNYLVVGLPLLSALTPEEFRAVLAHEFGHLSGHHGRFSGWIYRLRQTWIEVLTQVRVEKRYASFLFEPFLNWYAPLFNVYSFVLARAREYEADGYSVEVTGRGVAARALVRMYTKKKGLTEDFWPKFFTAANEDRDPPKDPFVRMLGGLGVAVDRDHAEDWFRQLLRVRTGYDDTHPALKDRLIALGYPSDSLTTPAIIEELVQNATTAEASAADTYLLKLPEGAVLSFERLLREQIVPPWRERHQYLQEARKRLSELDKKSSNEPLTEEELWERARLLAETGNEAAALPTLREIVRNNPKHVAATFSLGAVLLEENDESGIEFLEKAIALDRSFSGEAWRLTARFYRRHQREQEANDYCDRAEKFMEEQQHYYDTALVLSADDNFQPHGLDASELADLQTQLSKTERVGRAFLVRKVVEGQDPIFVLGVVSNYAWHDFHNQKDSDRILSELAHNIQLSGEKVLLFSMLEGKQKILRQVFSAIPGAQVFPT